MIPTMSNANLTPISYVVLGLVAFLGRATSYDMKRLANMSVGYFWTFPHSQLYAEPDRLVKLGLLHEDREEGGRRRRVYSVTDAGREELGDWLAEPEKLHEMFKDVTGLEAPLATLRQGDMVLEACDRFWRDIAENPPGADGIQRSRV